MYYYSVILMYTTARAIHLGDFVIEVQLETTTHNPTRGMFLTQDLMFQVFIMEVHRERRRRQ